MASFTLLSERQKGGFLLTVAGVVFFYFGVMMYFDQGMLLLGNAFMLVGLTVLLGVMELASVLLLRAKLQGSAMFFGGMLLVYYDFCIVGVLLEIYGAVLLFSGFLPVIFEYLRPVPIIGRLVPDAEKDDKRKVD